MDGQRGNLAILHLFSPAGIEHWFFERARLRSQGASAEELRAAAARYGVRSVQTSPAGTEPRAVLSDRSRMLIVRGSETDGAYGLVEFTSVAGQPAVRPHVHIDSEEGLYVADGEMTITVGTETHAAPAGTFALVPRGTVHSHAHRGDAPARVLMIVSPPGLERYWEQNAALRSAFFAPPGREKQSEVEALSERAGLRFAD